MNKLELYERAIQITREIQSLEKELEVAVRRMEGLSEADLYGQALSTTIQAPEFWLRMAEIMSNENLGQEERELKLESFGEEFFGDRNSNFNQLVETSSARLQMLRSLRGSTQHLLAYLIGSSAQLD